MGQIGRNFSPAFINSNVPLNDNLLLIIYSIRHNIGNDFYYKNALEIIFTIKMHEK